MPEPQHPMPNQLGGPLPNQMPNQIGVPVQTQGGPIPPSLSPGYRGPPGPGPPGPRMPRGPPYMDGPPPDQMIGAPPSPRYDGRPIMDPVWPPRGDPAGENEFDFFSWVKISVFFLQFHFFLVQAFFCLLGDPSGENEWRGRCERCPE